MEFSHLPNTASPIVRESVVDCEAHALGAAVLIVDYVPLLEQTDHVHSHSSITIVLRGRVEEETPNHVWAATPFGVLFKPAGTPHADRYGPIGCKTLQINFVTGFEFRELDLPHASAAICMNLQARRALQALIQPPRSIVAPFAFSELISELSGVPRESSRTPRWLERTKRIMDASDVAIPLSLNDLAHEAGVHPVHLTRQFRKSYGSSLREYFRDRRIKAAAEAVAARSASLTQIAHDFGYADQAHFSRAFRSFAFMTATSYRKALSMLD